nr:BAF_HP1_G0053060.mRNA.1.CDS.1 [Saccharomyces cerevisiae]
MIVVYFAHSEIDLDTGCSVENLELSKHKEKLRNNSLLLSYSITKSTDFGVRWYSAYVTFNKFCKSNSFVTCKAFYSLALALLSNRRRGNVEMFHAGFFTYCTAF